MIRKRDQEERLFEVRLNRVIGSHFAMGAAALLLSACVAMQPEDNDKWRNSQKPIIKERAESRWASLINGEIDKVYAYSSPDYRAVVALQQYKGKYGRVLEWRMAHVADISYDSPTVASVSVDVTYRAYLPGSVGKPIETNKLLTEKWLFKGGEWWYTDQ